MAGTARAAAAGAGDGRPPGRRAALPVDECIDLPRSRLSGHRAAVPIVEARDREVNDVGWDIVIVLATVIVGGCFAAPVMALLSPPEAQPLSLAVAGGRGHMGASAAPDPNRVPRG